MNEELMRRALRLAARARGNTSPNPMVGALLIKGERILGQGYHHKAGQPHAEIEAISDAERRGFSPKGATLYVTLEPCSTYGRTPPCTEAIIAAGIKQIMIGTLDPNPKHAGRGLQLLAAAGIAVEMAEGKLAEACVDLNEVFNHWIVAGTPWVTVKAAMTLDGKIATESGQSKWITSEAARRSAMRLRYASDAILVGVNTVIADDPSLTVRVGQTAKPRPLLRLVLDPHARIPLSARMLNDAQAHLTRVVVGPGARKKTVAALEKKVRVLRCPESESGTLDLSWLLGELGRQEVTSLLVEGGGETVAAFLEQKLARGIMFFYAPKVLGGARARRSVGGRGAEKREDFTGLQKLQWRKVGPDLLLQAWIQQRVARNTRKSA
jgi:diaminohydroxyphosphoribosylaminopyrimidine deaminase/5-amino-6-(5-phosphoribosylamino)uracil reductase